METARNISYFMKILAATVLLVLSACSDKKKQDAGILTTPGPTEIIGDETQPGGGTIIDNTNPAVIVDNNTGTTNDGTNIGSDDPIEEDDDQSRNLQFQYDDDSARCLDAQGVEGYNVGYIGQCGRITKTLIVDRDLSGADLRGAHFEKVLFIGSDFSEVDFKGAVLNKVTFINCNFTGVDTTVIEFSKVKLIKVQFNSGTYTLFIKKNWILFN